MSEKPFSTWFQLASAAGPPLRIGLVLDRPTLDRASATVVRDVQACNFAGIELVVLARSRVGELHAARGPESPIARLRRFRAEGGLAFAVFSMLDRWRAGRRDDPLELDDDRELLASVPVVAIGPAEPGRATPSGDEFERIRAARLDVVVQLGTGAVDHAIAAASRFGVWGFHHGDDVQYRGGPAAFWEMVDGSPICAVVLKRLAAGPDDDLVLDRATFATDPASLARTRRTAWYGSTHLLVRNLRLLHDRGWTWLEAHCSADPTPPVTGPIIRRPSAWSVVRWLVPLVARRLAGRLARIIVRSDDVLHWRIAIRVGGLPLGLDRPPDLAGFRWIESPAGHYFADPFPVEWNGRRWLFFEDYVYARDAAVIARGEIDGDGRLGMVREALDAAAHLSYPMVIESGGEAFMIPESSAQGFVRLYRAQSFPDGWTIAGELFPEAAVDTTVWFQDDRWWFFTTVHEPRGRAGMLMLFHADSIGGPWVPHPMNPISQDVRTNWAGGNLFLDGGRLVRPSQDGSRGYGYGLTLNEVVVLTPDDYAELTRVRITPDHVPGLLGLHTYNRVGDLEVIDGKVARRRSSVA